MTRPLVPMLLCAALALTALPAAAAAAQERPPKELWDEFPLEPTATPAAASPQATPSPRVVHVRERDDGMAPEALLALLVTAAGVGAIAAHMAARRLRRAALHAATPTAANHTAGGHPVATTKPPSTPMNGAPKARPMAAEAKAKPTRKRPAKPTPKRSAKPASKPAARPAPQPAPGSPARSASPSPRAPSRSPAPQPAGSGRQAGRFVPGRTTRAGAASPPVPARCSVKLSKRPPMGRFAAIADTGDRVLAWSPVFRLKREEGESGPSPPEALGALVEELTAAGWRKIGAGRAPWELQFERQPQGALTRRAGPPRA